MKTAYWKEWCEYSPIASVDGDKATLEDGTVVNIVEKQVNSFSDMQNKDRFWTGNGSNPYRKPRIGDIYRTHYKPGTDEIVGLFMNPKLFAYMHTEGTPKIRNWVECMDP